MNATNKSSKFQKKNMVEINNEKIARRAYNTISLITVMSRYSWKEVQQVYEQMQQQDKAKKNI